MYILNVTIHVFAAIVWLGGMFFFALVGVPVLRTVEPPDLRAKLFRQLGERARTVGWFSLVILIGTGLLNMHFRSVLDVACSHRANSGRHGTGGRSRGGWPPSP